jgi:hypothetical protein
VTAFPVDGRLLFSEAERGMIEKRRGRPVKIALAPHGADSLSDLVGALRPLTRSSRSDQTAVVLINGHLAGQTEFDNLPREAIERVEVLPESVALQYGFSENQRVLNFLEIEPMFAGVKAYQGMDYGRLRVR